MKNIHSFTIAVNLIDTSYTKPQKLYNIHNQENYKRPLHLTPKFSLSKNQYNQEPNFITNILLYDEKNTDNYHDPEQFYTQKSNFTNKNTYKDKKGNKNNQNPEHIYTHSY